MSGHTGNLKFDDLNEVVLSNRENCQPIPLHIFKQVAHFLVFFSLAACGGDTL